MFERPRSGERALLVRIGFGQPPSQDELTELESLATSAGAEVLSVITGTRRSPDPRLFVGSGKAEEIHSAVKTLAADLVVFDHPLSPSQERNLEALLTRRQGMIENDEIGSQRLHRGVDFLRFAAADEKSWIG